MVYVKAKDAWDFFLEHRGTFAYEGECLAEDEDNETRITMSEDREGYPVIYTFVQGILLEETEVSTRTGLQDELEQLYGDYISDSDEYQKVLTFNGKPKEDEGDPPRLFLDDLVDREQELEAATEEYLDILLGGEQDTLLQKSEKRAFLDHCCEFLFRKFGASMYRPMIIGVEGGKDINSEYPYEEIGYDPDPFLYPDEQ